MYKRAITIFLCSLFLLESLFPRIEFADLRQLPELFQHFEKHQEESPGISFLEFLYLHYGDSQHLAQDAKTHEKLPFSKAHRSISFLLANDLSVLSVSAQFNFLMKIEAVVYPEVPSGSIPLSIWQPPKI